MKKIIVLLLSGLLVWNVVLTTQLSDSLERIDELETANQNISNITSGNNSSNSSQYSVIEEDGFDIEKVVDMVSPAVVTITTSLNDRAISTGSGVIYAKNNDDIWIVTNNHVIEGGDDFELLFTNQQVVEAELIGADELSDLAVLKATIDFDITPVAVGDSAILEPGQTVLAIGSPAGEDFAGTVTKGIISGVDRTLAVDTDNDGRADWDLILLQTDAAINPGNSGGALVNLNGELIGINTIKIATQAYEGMGFAIPSNEVVNIISQLEAHGEVKRPSLGVSVFSLQDINPYTKFLFNIEEESGLYVQEVQPNSPASEADIQEGDIITKLNDQEINTFKQFRQILYSLSEGDELDIEIVRGNDIIEVTVTL